MRTHLQVTLGVMLAALGITFSQAEIPAQTKGAAKAALNQAHHSILTELHQAKHLLDLGLHDYHGHRAKADHEVSQAIHLLEHHRKGEHKAIAKGEHKKTPHHDGPITEERQKASDSKLRQAEKLVQAAHLQLNNLHTKHGHKHHHEAAQLLTKATREIEQALHVVHNYNHHHKKAQAANP